MIKKLSFLSVLAILLVIILLLAPRCTCGQGAQQAAAPSGPPRVTSFKIANENIAPGDVPLFTWEAANASAVTITQDGEEVYHIEAMPDSSAVTSFNPLHGQVYASSTDEKEVGQLFSPGVYPIGFKGASNGKPSKIISDFGDNFTVQGSAEIKALSLDGLVTAKRVTFFNLVAEGQGSSPPQITAPPCASPGLSEPIIPLINNWSMKDGEIDEGTEPQFEFQVTNPGTISITQGGKLISYVQVINPPTTGSSSLPSLSGEAHASISGDYDVKQPYSPGVYPVIYQGSSSGRPATIISDLSENFTKDFAEITVCSPTGHKATATVNFNIVRRGVIECVDLCKCLSDAEVKAEPYPLYKCNPAPCWKQLVKYGSSLKMAHETSATAREIYLYNYKYCFRECPPGCECISQWEANNSGFKDKDRCTPDSCGSVGLKMGDSGEGNKGSSEYDKYCYPALPPPPKPLSIIFTASRNVVEPMGPVTLKWNVTPCDNMTVKLVSDGVERTVLPSGSEGLVVTKSACYYITAECQGIRGVKSQCITVRSMGLQPPPVRPPMPPPVTPPIIPPVTPPACTTCPSTQPPTTPPLVTDH
jgi:hypothetical protein